MNTPLPFTKFVGFYGKRITVEGFEEALKCYYLFYKSIGFAPELTREDYDDLGLALLPEQIVSHVIYRAVKAGFCVDTQMV